MLRLPRHAPCLAALLLGFPPGTWGAEPGRAEDPPASPAGEVGTSPPPAREPLQPASPGTSPVVPPEPPRWRAAVTLGSGTSSGHSYVMFGGLLGYEVAAGFELCLDGQYWGGAQPSFGRVAPGVNWYAALPYRPYLGVYYARWFVGGDLPDQDAVGGRAGLTIASAPRAAFGAGLVWERVLNCSADCDAWWPELSIGFRF
jgi:hypothetical protein